MMKIYTKTGDDGTTALYGGKRLSKADIRIEAYGTVDELNSHLGIVLSFIEEKEFTELLISIQSRLFDIGTHLA
ncbi:MAG TPA: ATP:cob(I)alamin adenosyltransferase, partial [Chitinophagales bacterium]|nr:ATP:cob(I)alamin adenosyltransferase [Chitinophagales bacterium]